MIWFWVPTLWEIDAVSWLLMSYFCALVVYTFFSAVPAKHMKTEITRSKKAVSVNVQSINTKSKESNKTFIKKPTAKGKKKTLLNSTVSKGKILPKGCLFLIYGRCNKKCFFAGKNISTSSKRSTDKIGTPKSKDSEEDDEENILPSELCGMSSILLLLLYSYWISYKCFFLQAWKIIVVCFCTGQNKQPSAELHEKRADAL